MDYAYNNSAEKVTKCGCDNGCSHPKGSCSSPNNPCVCWRRCFNEIYQPENHKNPRLRYDCKKLVCQYVYRALDKQATEIFYGLKEYINIIKIFPILNVFSIGSGPSTELLSLHYLSKLELNKKINYLGIDIEKTWEIIHKKIKDFSLEDEFLSEIDYKLMNAKNIAELRKIFNKNTNIIILNYVLSSFIANSDKNGIDLLFDNISTLIKENNIKNCIIIINDVNLPLRGTDKFMNLIDNLIKSGLQVFDYKKKYFYNSKLPTFGEMFPSNYTIFENFYPKAAFRGNSASSAMLVINTGV